MGRAAERIGRVIRRGVTGGCLALGLAAVPPMAAARTVTPSVTVTATAHDLGVEGTPTATPTPTQTPQRTGDLGNKEVHGRVYDTDRGIDAGLAGATVSYAAPSGSGAVETDSEGAFAFSLFLHDTDLVRVGAAAPGFHSAEVRLTGIQLWYLAGIDIGLEPSERTLFRITGRVSRDPYCALDSRVTVILEPADTGGRFGSIDLLPSEDAFVFEDVPDGAYVVSAESDCRPSRAAPVPVYVRGADAYTEIHFDTECPSVLVIEPDRGPPGTIIGVRGRCYYIHSGGSADVYADGERVTSVRGDTPGTYATAIILPPDTRAGWHTIQVTTPGGLVIGTGQFYLEEGGAVCSGDCNADGRVDIAELIVGVRLVLGYEDAACAGLATGQGDAAIAQLVAAVGSAIHGCPPSSR
jgi:hypothetical protein